jgi:enoyl-CoA hydratase/carnithine racemase
VDLSELTQIKPSLVDEGRRLELRLDHGKVNACGSAVIADFERVAEIVRENRRIRSVLMYSEKVSSSGKGIFVAGADVTERMGWSDDQVIAHVRRQRDALLSLRALPVFSVVVVDGIALGLGTELMIAFDYRIAGPQARFALPETGLGIIPGALGSALLSSLIGANHALRMGCTGEEIDAGEAARIGLVDELQADGGLAVARGRALCELVTSRAPRAVAAFKSSVLDGADLAARVAVERMRYESQVRNGDAARGREAFKEIREGRQPSWPER